MAAPVLLGRRPAGLPVGMAGKAVKGKIARHVDLHPMPSSGSGPVPHHAATSRVRRVTKAATSCSSCSSSSSLAGSSRAGSEGSDSSASAAAGAGAASASDSAASSLEASASACLLGSLDSASASGASAVSGASSSSCVTSFEAGGTTSAGSSSSSSSEASGEGTARSALKGTAPSLGLFIEEVTAERDKYIAESAGPFPTGAPVGEGLERQFASSSGLRPVRLNFPPPFPPL
mmetsp:Transcript_21034/g.50036  ORF Transcript_21034/g.50036 Transcript_21034/m.50036 type:complete len:233 (-) Transcript_21034:593-1291(-)